MTAAMGTEEPESTGGMRVAFRVDASLSIGSGHVMRCLTLADALCKKGVDCHFLCREHPGHLNNLITAHGFALHMLPKEEGDAEMPIAGQPRPATVDESASNPPHADWLGTTQASDARDSLEILQTLAPDWLIVDHYALDAQWENRVRNVVPGIHLMVIDDLADRPHPADVLLDQNLGRGAGEYRDLVPNHCRVLIGPRYALLRPEFAEWRNWSLERRKQGGPVRRLLVSLGGVDKDNITGRVLDALYEIALPEGLEITVVMGVGAPWLDDVRGRARQMSCKTEVVVNVDDMARRMAEADLAIGAAGSTAWERCCLGLPSLVLILAENQQSIAQALHAEGAAINCGIIEDKGWQEKLSGSIKDLLDHPDRCEPMVFRAAGITRGEGASQVTSEVKNRVLS